MTSEKYDKLKEFVNLMPIPSAIMSVEKLPDGSCGDVRFAVVNNLFAQNFIELFAGEEHDHSMSIEDFAKTIEGQLYTLSLPKEPNFEGVCFRAAWEGAFINTYVDTTRMYGYWTQDLLNPIAEKCDEENISYCQFSYTLNKTMDSGKYAAVSPDIASFVIKSCLELRDEKSFEDSMEVVTRELREYTGSYAASTLTIDSEFRTFEVISADVADDKIDVREVFSSIPYEIIDSWKELVRQTSSVIIENDHDLSTYEKKAPEWVKTLRDNDVRTLCLVPFIHKQEIIGYLYITNFDPANLVRVKETGELVSFFLASEVAKFLFLQKLEYLSNVDILTGVYNRNCMNIYVDELSTKLKLNPKPFSVAFCDLNGLKTINDKAGHGDGDKLLKDAASLLREVFTGDKIFRAGGDEFAIISVKSSLEKFEQKIKTIKEKANDPDWLCFAVGYYHDATDGDLRLALRYADERMYKDKKAFYEMHPEKRR